ncbi:NAD(P)-dependent oxidoreductase [Neobacillus sp.]|uniref:NAD-dependent epimerase/dehydratase family protein n=1 Tax=Neobacillus sp. TaxID=2675273 RepID=UPI0028A193E8|nr:NAD(P)-dependent oxidoreductase [Neobacillus sp.]
MKALVTGATGFLGQKLALRLVSMGYEVTGIGRNTAIGETLKKHGVHFVPCSLEDKTKIAELCKEQHFVFHCGALSSPWGKYRDFFHSNVIGTQNMIEGCKRADVNRLIHVSTPSLYFNFDERLDVKEYDPLPKAFVNHYAKTKHLAELEMDKAFQEGLPTITIRPRALFGPGDNAILPRLIKVCEKGFFPKVGTGSVQVDITYVENVVDALLLCMHSEEKTLGQKYNITNGVRINLYDVIEQVMVMLGKSFKYKNISFERAFTIAKYLERFSLLFLAGKEPVLTRYSVSVLAKSQTLNIEKAKNELGYTPRITIEEGIHEFVKWWETHGN